MEPGDHHANITRRMIQHTDLMIGYRTQPHFHFETGVEAVAAPRWHSEEPGSLAMEARIYWNLEPSMKDRGWKTITRSRDSYDRFFAMVQCIHLNGGKASGGGDPRNDYGGLGKWPLE